MEEQMKSKRDSGISPVGSILCFVIYLILCGQVITLLEHQWLIIPPALQVEITPKTDDGNTIKVVYLLLIEELIFGSSPIINMILFPFR